MGTVDQTAPSQDGLTAEAMAWFFQHGLDIFLVAKDDAVASVNPAWERLTGWPCVETLGRRFLDFIPPADKPATQDIRRQMDATGSAVGEHRLICRDGREIWVSSQVRVLGPGSFLTTLKDITQQRAHVEEFRQLAESTALLREASGQFAWTYNPQTRAYVFNHDVRDLGGGDADDVRTSVDVGSEIHPEDAPAMDEAFKHTLRTGEYRVIEYRNKRPDGAWGRLRAAWRGVRLLPNARWELLGITQDITELAAARDAAIRGEQAAQAAAEAKSQFLANMSHEIRTPMNGVLGVLHLLKNETLSAGGRELIQEALACGSMLAELLNDVIDFSKIEAGRLELSPEPVDPAAALDGVIGILRPQAEAKAIELRTEIAGDIGWVSIDPVRLRQMLFNLIGNAVKFTLEGAVTARISVQGRGAVQRLRVEIEDTGVGISPEAQEALFQRFTQADGSTTRRFGGSGLGLSITRVLAELMDGEVTFESTPGEGSVFRIDIAAPACSPAGSEMAEDQPWLEGLSVLVVEDNPTNRLIATRMLENLGAQVETANDGALGVEAACSRPFDLIFMDIQMPVMDGIAATRAIRALPGPVSQIPIVAMTANAMSHQVESYFAAGMNGTVFKPMSPTALLKELARLSADSAPDVEARAQVA
jgi:PAS domain S-box-containing protein